MVADPKNLKIGVGFAAFCLFNLIYLIPNQVGKLTEEASLMPVFFTGVILILSIMLIVRSVRGSSDSASHPAHQAGRKLGTLALVTVVMVGYSLLLEQIGFIVTSLLALIALFLVFGVRDFRKILGISVPTVVILYLAFEKLLKAPLPSGDLLERLLG